jgi:predicted nucleic acid-binding Zn ribbon protein
MEKCSNFENCGNTFPEVKDDEIPFQFCSEECKEYITKKEKFDAIHENTQGLIDKGLLLD